MTSKLAWSLATCFSGVQRRSVSWSISTAWRCEKVPRSLSWPDRRTGKAFGEQRAERQMLGHRPVDALARVDHLAAALEQSAHRLVGVEVGRDRW